MNENMRSGQKWNTVNNYVEDAPDVRHGGTNQSV